MVDGGASQRRPPLALMPREGARPGGRGVGVGAQETRVEQAGGSRSPQPKRGAVSGARRAGNGPLRLLLEGRVLGHLWAVGGGTPLDFLSRVGALGQVDRTRPARSWGGSESHFPTYQGLAGSLPHFLCFPICKLGAPCRAP